MQYIERTAEGLRIKSRDADLVVKKGLKQFLDTLLQKEYATFDGRIRALRREYGLKNNVPIYIHKQLCFYMSTNIRDTTSTCINFHEVLSIREGTDKNAEIIFKDLTIKKLSVSYQKLLKRHIHTARFLSNL
ncbi:MAG: competence protein ComK [Bacillota bacterium]